MINVDNINDIIIGLEDEGYKAELVVRRAGKQWLAAVVDDKGGMLLCKQGINFLCATDTNLNNAVARLNGLCA